MGAQPFFQRRTLLRAATATAAGLTGLAAAGNANAAERAAGQREGNTPAAEPRIYSTAEWGARAPSSPIVVLDHVPTYIAIHHTVTPGNSTDYSLKHAKKICRDIQDLHMDTNGWSDSGQQFTNTRGGYRLEGRHQSLKAVRGGRQHVQGANVADHNDEVIGIENEGLYSSVDVPKALWTSLVSLAAWIAGQYQIPVKDIRGHRDFNSTECPGDVLYGRLKELRDAVAKAMGVAAPEALLTWPLLRPGSEGPQVRAAQHLLRAKGFTQVPVDGFFGGSTKEAVARLANASGIERHVCAAAHHSTVDETGYLGSDIWPLITPAVPAGADSGVGAAVDTLLRTGDKQAPRTGALDQSDWKRLLR